MKTTKQILVASLSLLLLLSILAACSESDAPNDSLQSVQGGDTQQTEAMTEAEDIVTTLESDTIQETEANVPEETESNTSEEIETDTPKDTVKRTVTREEWVKAFENLEKITNVTVTNSFIQVIEWSDTFEEETLGENEHRLPDHMEILEVRKYDNGVLFKTVSHKARDDLSGTPEQIIDSKTAYRIIAPENSLEAFNFDEGVDGMLDFISELEEFDYYGYDKFAYSESKKTYSAPFDFYEGDVSLELGFEDGILTQMIMLQVASFDEGTLTSQIATHITDIGTTEKITMPIEAVKTEIDAAKEKISSANGRITWNGPETENINTFVYEFINQLKFEKLSSCNFSSDKLNRLSLEFTNLESVDLGKYTVEYEEYTIEYDNVLIVFNSEGLITEIFIENLAHQEQVSITLEYDAVNS